MRNKMVAVLLLAFFLAACTFKRSEEEIVINKYGYGLDSLRRSLGLPVISPNHRVANRGTDFLIFENTDPNHFPCYITKCIFWDSISVYEERNYFYKTDSERLVIYYLFKKVKGMDTIGRCNLYERNLRDVKDTGIFLLQPQSDSVLRSWKLNY